MNKIREILIFNRYIFIAFFVPVLIVVLAFIVEGIYPFGEQQIAVIDMYHQYVPFLGELQNKLQSAESLFYTWNGAAGCNFWNLLAYYGASPLNLLLFFFPGKLIMEGVTFVLLIKIGLAGSFMAIYLRYLNERNDMIMVAFSTLYALSSYVLAYYWCIMWMDAVFLLPLCILGLNKVMDGASPVIYVLSLAVTVMSNYYIAIMVCIFILFYFPALYFLKNRNMGIRHCALVTGKSVGYSLLAICMAAFMLLPTYISMQSTYYISSEIPEDIFVYNDAIDVINQLLPYTEVTFREGLPNLYCGMIVVVLLVMYFINEEISLRQKMINSVFLLFMFMSLNTNKLDFLWHGLHYPNQLPYRYTFVICFVLISIAYETFQKKDSFKIKHVWIMLAVGAGYYLVAQKILENKAYSIQLFFYGGLAWLVLYSITIVLYRRKDITSKAFVFLIAALIIIEAMASTCTAFDKVGNSYRRAYFENYNDIEKLVEIANKNFSRAEMDYIYTLNDPAFYHYRGVSQFSSTINSDTTYIMEKIGLDGSPGRNRFNYNQTSPVNNALLNIEYIISKNKKFRDKDFTKVAKEGYSRLYRSNYPLAIGYMTGEEIRTWNTESNNPFDVLDDYVRAATGNAYDKVFEPMKMADLSSSGVAARKEGENTVAVSGDSKQNGRSVKMTYRSNKTQKYYVFIETYNAKYITVENGNDTEKIDIRHDCGSIVNIGTIKKGKEFTITVEYNKGKAGDIVCYVNSLNYEEWDKAYEILSSNVLEVTDSGDNYINAKINVEESGILVTSIPYDKGWKLEVDGEKREISELVGGTFISLSLDEGEHEINLKFTPPGLLIGVLLSLLSIAILIVLQLIRRRVALRVRSATDLQELQEEQGFPLEEVGYSKEHEDYPR